MAKKKLSNKSDDIVMVGDGADDDADEDEDRDEGESDEKDVEEDGDDEGEDEDEGKKKPKKKSPRGDSDEDDERVGHGEDEEDEDEEEPQNKRRRETPKERRERQKKAQRRNQVELDFLRQRNETLERRLSNVEQRTARNEAGSIDQRINSLQSQLKVADQVLAKAIEQGSGEDAVEAQSIRDKIRDNINRLNTAKQEMSRRTESDDSEPDSRLVYHAQRWMAKNDWYTLGGTDPDSRKVARIDAKLVREGFDPRSAEYWDELTERCREELPHLFDDADTDDDGEEDDSRGSRKNGSRKEKKGNGPKFSTGGRERTLRKNEVYVSAERKQAMIDAGVWDDPVLRKKYLKSYRKWDRENPEARSR